MFERATWPLRKLSWKIEERVAWPIADAFRRGRSPSRIRRRSVPTPSQPAPAEPQADAAISDQRVPSSLKRRLGASIRDVSVVLATVAVAAGAGIWIATLVDPSGDTQTAASPASAASGAAPAQPQSQPGAEASGPSTLQGVSPDFESSSKAGGSGSSTASEVQTSPLKDTNSKPSSIPPGVADAVAAMGTARDFAGAFVLYEIGESDAKVRKIFARTATPSLARALRDRPPRLPEGVQVPTAKVQNVVLGAKRGREVDASVSLLRLGDLSELRLTLIRRHETWAVSEVRG